MLRGVYPTLDGSVRLEFCDPLVEDTLTLQAGGWLISHHTRRRNGSWLNPW